MTPTRPVYRHTDLRRLLEPGSVAIVGASPRAGAFGERTFSQLTDFPGRIYLVNARYERIGQHLCHPSLDSLPEVPDCVVIAVSRDLVESYVEECARLGVGGVLIFASGYAETGMPERKALQARLSQIAARSGLRILGPNSMGFANYSAQALLSFATYSKAGVPTRPAIGVATQSGAMSNSLGQAAELGVAFSHVLASGNSCDVDVADLVAYLAEAPHCGGIACVIEGLAEPQRFLEAAALARSNGRPLVVCKTATGTAGAQAAASHTGSLAGSNEAYNAAFARVGAIVVERFEDLLEVVSFMVKAPTPKAAGVAMISTSGGAAIMAADSAQRHGIDMPQPGPQAHKVLTSRIPDFGSARNPCDVTAQVMSDPESLSACAGALLDDPAFGAVIMAQPQAYEFAVPRIRAIGELARQADKAAANVLVSQWLCGPGAKETEQEPSMGLFRSIDRCFATLRRWQDWHAWDHTAHERDRPATADSATRADVRRWLLAAREDVLTERESKQILQAYGVPVVQETLVDSADAAVEAARRAGYPVVLKGESPDLPHKTEAGVVQLGLADDSAVRRAHALISQRARAAGAHVRLTGVLVQPMIPAGLELMVGARADHQFGPLIVVGMGGTLVELLRDTVVDLAPIGPAAAADMLDRLRASKLLDGFRGSAVVDRVALARIISRVSSLAADFADLIAEIDVNPLICSERGIVAVDALIVRRPTGP